MSNPILKPNDPRFAQPAIIDGEGKNRFGDPEHVADSATDLAADSAGDRPTDVYVATPVASEQPYQPRYETTAASRGTWLLALAVLGVAGVAAGAAAFSGMTASGWIFPLCGIVASAAAWLLAYGDLCEMRLGARDETGRSVTLAAMWLGVLGLVGCLAYVAAMIWFGLSLLPSIL